MFKNTFSGSFYKMQGLGRMAHITQADIMGRGGTAIAIADKFMINSVNPAGLIFIDITRISSDFYHETNNLKTLTVNGLSNYSNLYGVKLSIPLAINRFVISLGIKPLTYSNLKAESDGELSTGSKYLKQIINKGGLNQFTLGMATGFKNRIFTGLFFHYNFGRLEENWKVDFVSDRYRDTSDKIISTYWGGSVTGGLIFRIRSNIFIGAIYSHNINLSANNYIDYTFGKSSKTNHLKMKIPYSWGIGGSYIINKKLRFSFDYFNQPWSRLTIDNNTINGSHDSYFIAGGLELLPIKKLTAGYFKKINYRAGFNYNKLNYQDSNGNELLEYMGTIGFGFPFYGIFGRFDIALGYGKRGDLNKNTVEETVFKLMISVSGGEKWFLRRRKK